MANLCPAVLTLDRVLRTQIPFFEGKFKDAKGDSFRLQRGGNRRHELGLCLDIILFSEPWYKDASIDWKTEKKLAENLVQAFIDLRDEMRWTEIILQDMVFWEPEYYKRYTQDRAHFTHIHIDWMTNNLKGRNKSDDEIFKNSPQANNNNFSAPLIARLSQINKLLSNGQLSNIDLASIIRVLSKDVNPIGDWQVVVAQWTWIYTFGANDDVSWRDPYSKESGKGKWKVHPGKIIFTWFNSTTTESWNLPIQPNSQSGITKMEGKTYDIKAVRL